MATTAASSAFREAYVSADLTDTDDFDAWASRQLRYKLFWAMYENSVYRDIHKFARSVRAQYGLYKYIRNIYNPAYRLGEFWKAHLMGGSLDLAAGDGKTVPSSLPIITENEAIRSGISALWRWSNWQIKKDIVSLWGSVLGDVAMRIVSAPDKGKVYIEIVHPSVLKEVETDSWGNVKAYTIEKKRLDPRMSQEREVTYTETATRNGVNVVYQTYLDGVLYPWDGQDSQWELPYGFVPMVVVQHNNVGLEWGWSEIHPVWPKFREVDDIASKLSDQIRKLVHSPWLFAGVPDPKAKTAIRVGPRTEPTEDRPEPGREEVPALYGPAGATATPLVAPLDIANVNNYVMSILKDIEKDYPELALDLRNAQGETSGKALRINRQPAETKVLQRRVMYDDAMVRIQMMGLAIGGLYGYKGFDGLGLESYASGALEHQIGERPVFQKDITDDLEYNGLFWDVANKAKLAGLDLFTYLRRSGWKEEEITDLQKTPEYQARLAGLEMTMTASKTQGLEKNG